MKLYFNFFVQFHVCGLLLNKIYYHRCLNKVNDNFAENGFFSEIVDLKYMPNLKVVSFSNALQRQG